MGTMGCELDSRISCHNVGFRLDLIGNGYYWGSRMGLGVDGREHREGVSRKTHRRLLP